MAPRKITRRSNRYILRSHLRFTDTRKDDPQGCGRESPQNTPIVETGLPAAARKTYVLPGDCAAPATSFACGQAPVVANARIARAPAHPARSVRAGSRKTPSGSSAASPSSFMKNTLPGSIRMRASCASAARARRIQPRRASTQHDAARHRHVARFRQCASSAAISAALAVCMREPTQQCVVMTERERSRTRAGYTQPGGAPSAAAARSRISSRGPTVAEPQPRRECLRQAADVITRSAVSSSSMPDAACRETCSRS